MSEPDSETEEEPGEKGATQPETSPNCCIGGKTSLFWTWGGCITVCAHILTTYCNTLFLFSFASFLSAISKSETDI